MKTPLAFLVRAPASRTGIPGSRPAPTSCGSVDPGELQIYQSRKDNIFDAFTGLKKKHFRQTLPPQTQPPLLWKAVDKVLLRRTSDPTVWLARYKVQLISPELSHSFNASALCCWQNNVNFLLSSLSPSLHRKHTQTFQQMFPSLLNLSG